MKALRRSKRQPDYDPNELADLIETPAVGTGVGSHLLSRNDFPPASGLDLVTTVVTSIPATDPISLQSTDPVSVPAPVVTCLEDTSLPSTVATSEVTPPHPVARLWISESGEVVPESRVRLVRTSRDCLSAGEQAVYDVLRQAAALRETATARSVQAGYEFLVRRTRFSRKTIQRTIDRLIAKDFIDIETQADIYRRTPTVYRVFAETAVLERLAQRGRTHIARIGPGVAFVTPLPLLADLTTVVS
jgi:hypothetical protein